MVETTHTGTHPGTRPPDAHRPGTRRAQPPPGHRRRLFRHGVEMVVAMVAGMLLFDPIWTAFGRPLGAGDVLARPDVDALVMATNMTLGMTVWMRHRGHGWEAVGEMSGAMFLPVLLLLVPWWAGVLDADVLAMGAHVLMLPAMAVAMLRRRDEYAGHPRPRPTPGPVVAALWRRWPTWLALLMTVDNWLVPVVPDPWLMLILPAAYLGIGAYRRQLGEPRVLAVQLAGAAGWLALAAVAATVDDPLAGWLVGLGWLAHAVWDVVHHRLGRVVPRGYAEWCAVLDVVVGVTVLLAL